MSQLERLQESKTKKPNKNNSNLKGKTGLYTYHPSDAHRKSPLFHKLTLEGVLLLISNYIARNCSLSFGYKAENESYFVILREKSSDWQTAQAVSVWHQEIARAIIGLGYYLSEVNPEFPNSSGSFDPHLNDW